MTVSTIAETRVELSIVTTMYYSGPYIAEFHRRATEAARAVASYEIIFVNDGSPDDSLRVARDIVAQDPHVRVIDLARNFGHHRAMMIGLGHATGRRVFLIDCDLEEDPRNLADFEAEMASRGADVVFGVQPVRKGTFVRRFGGDLFWKLFALLTDTPIVRNMVTSRLMTRRYVDALLLHAERELFLGGVWAATGFEQVPLVIPKSARSGSSYTLTKRIALSVNAITSFSSKPLVFVFYLGVLISAMSGIAALGLIVSKLFFKGYLMGWPSLIVSIWLLGGITIFCLGIVGVYLSKIYSEVKQRPYSIVRAIYERADPGGAES